MIFNSKKELLMYLKYIVELGYGSQGITYHDKKLNKAIKVYHEVFDDEMSYLTKNKEETLKFNQAVNNTYIFPDDVLMLNDKIVGYTSKFVSGKNLQYINPLTININNLMQSLKQVKEDTKLISENKIKSYDVMYNIMYKNGRLYVVDTLEYGINKTSYEDNRACIDNEIMLFLVDDYFDYFIKDNLLLNEMYMDYNVSSLEFLKEFRKKLSEYLDKDITKLNDAKSLVKKSKATYQRSI